MQQPSRGGTRGSGRRSAGRPGPPAARTGNRQNIRPTALPRWLVEEYAERMDVVPVQLGKKGVAKQIYLGARDSELHIDYLKAFIELASKGAAAASTP